MKFLLFLLGLGVALFLTGRCSSRPKPTEMNLINAAAKAPVQVDAASDSAQLPTEFSFDGKTYRLFPRAEYSIEGLIVSEHRSDSIWDLAHARTGDTLNSRDICTVWGSTLSSGVYRDVDFWSGDWTCYYQIPASKNADITMSLFKPHEMSNTHVIAIDETIRKQINDLEIGDEYRMKGKLVDYEQVGLGLRRTSLIRTDKDNGACEILLVSSVEILKSHGMTARLVRDTGKFTIALAALLILATMAKAIFTNKTA